MSVAVARHLMPVIRRTAGSNPCLKTFRAQIPARGKKDWVMIRRDFPWRPSHPLDDPWMQSMMRPWGLMAEQMKDMADRFSLNRVHPTHGEHAEVEEAKLDSEGMLLKLNVSHYEPEDLKIKVLGDRLIVWGKHEQKSDEYSTVSREFTREFLIPEEIDADSMASRLTDNGHLVISAKAKPGSANQGRTITIERGSSTPSSGGTATKTGGTGTSQGGTDSKTQGAAK